MTDVDLVWVDEPLSVAHARALRSYLAMTGDSGRPRITLLHWVGGEEELVIAVDDIAECLAGLVEWVQRGQWFSLMTEAAMVDDPVVRPQRGELVERLAQGDGSVYTGVLGMAWQRGHRPKRFISRPVDLNRWAVRSADVAGSAVAIAGRDELAAAWHAVVGATERVS